jgi:hypothetical protein
LGGFVEIGKRALKLAPEAVCNAAIEVGDGTPGVDADRLTEVGGRMVKVALGLVFSRLLNAVLSFKLSWPAAV